MKTKTKSQIVLKDGKSTIASWNTDSATRPTVGERIDLPEKVTGKLKDYASQAEVTMVRMDPQHGELVVEAAAQSNLPVDQRPVVILNASMVPERLRQEVEDHLRKQLVLPVLDWEESTATTPIVQLHPFQGRLKTPVAQLQEELHEMIVHAIEPAHP